MYELSHPHSKKSRGRSHAMAELAAMGGRRCPARVFPSLLTVAVGRRLRAREQQQARAGPDE